MPGMRATTINNNERSQYNVPRLEYCVIIDIDIASQINCSGVQCHESPESHAWNTCSVKMRSVKPGSETLYTIHSQVAVLQTDLIGHKFGHPYTPRVGDFVAVLFVENQLPLILGGVHSVEMYPICRAPSNNYSNPIDEKYTDVRKLCQWKEPVYDKDRDVVAYKDPKKPTCTKWFHTHRDQMTIYDFCQEGDKCPDCDKCTSIDYVKREKNTWRKAYSAETGSCQAPNHRLEDHVFCGSFLRWESETGPSVEYSEGCGHIRMENRQFEDDTRGHLNFNPNGTIDIHSEDSNPGKALVNETLGARVAVFSDEDTFADDHGLIAAEMIYLPKLAVVRIYKDGCVRAISNTDKAEMRLNADGTGWLWDHSRNTYFEMKEDGTAEVHSETKILLDAPLTHVTGNMQIDGFCDHDGCSCGGA